MPAVTSIWPSCWRGHRGSYAEQADLQAALQSSVSDRNVDLVCLNHADPLLLNQVTSNAVLLHGDPNRWQEFRAYAFQAVPGSSAVSADGT